MVWVERDLSKVVQSNSPAMSRVKLSDSNKMSMETNIQIHIGNFSSSKEIYEKEKAHC